MANTLSVYFDDELVVSNLRLHFDYEEMWDFDFKTVFGSIVEREDDLFLELRGRGFSIDKLTGDVVEVK